MIAFVRLFLDAHKREQYLEPALYIKGSGEVLFLALIVSYVLTTIFEPEKLEKNALKDLFGYNNPCVVIDHPLEPMWRCQCFPCVHIFPFDTR